MNYLKIISLVRFLESSKKNCYTKTQAMKLRIFTCHNTMVVHIYRPKYEAEYLMYPIIKNNNRVEFTIVFYS